MYQIALNKISSMSLISSRDIECASSVERGKHSLVLFFFSSSSGTFNHIRASVVFLVLRGRGFW